MNVQQIITYMEHNAYIADEVTDMCIEALKKEAINEQIMWERNIALSQLEEIGVGLGAKMDVVKEALEKQIPMKVIYHDNCGNETPNQSRCPKCHEAINDTWYWTGESWCPYCGQKLDWGD